MVRTAARLDLGRIETAISRNRALRGLGEAAGLAERAFLDTRDPRAFDIWAQALVRGGWLERLEALLGGPLALEPGRISAWRIRSAQARLDYCEALRRTEAHLSRFGPDGAEALAMVADFCRTVGMSRRDLREITGGELICELAPDLPETRPRWTEAEDDWPRQIADRWARGEKRGTLTKLFLARYDWLNRDARVPEACWKVLKAGGEKLSEHVRMAPWLNGQGSLAALETYVATLYEQQRTADIASLLASGAPSWRLAFYRALALGDLGLSGADLRPAAEPVGEREADFRRLLDLRAEARTEAPPLPLPAPRGRRRRFALCVSGQLRAWRIALPPLIELLKTQGEVDVFVSTWRRTAAFSRRFAHKQFSPLALEYISQLPDPFDQALAAVLPQLGDDPDELARTIGEALGTPHVEVENERAFERRLPQMVERFEPEAVNQYKMYYKIHAAWRLQRRHAKATGVDYDFVLRVRPDYMIRRLHLGEVYDRVDNDAVVAGSYAYFEAFDDRFAIGSPAAMARHAAVWSRIRKAGTHRCLPLVGDVLAEDLMMANLVASGCQPIVLREIEVVSQNELHVRVSDEEIIAMLEACAAAGPLTKQQAKLARILARGHGGALAERAGAIGRRGRRPHAPEASAGPGEPLVEAVGARELGRSR